jgi:amidase
VTTEGLWRLDGHDLRASILEGRVTARQATEAHLARLEAVNGSINAIVRVTADEALATADALDRAYRAGEPPGPLHGWPITTKITNDQRGCATDLGVRLFRDHVATEDSPLVAHLRRAGAVIIGRSNSPAFAMRFCTDNVLHGKTWNPWNRAVTAGGSSGGAGAAVAAGIGVMAQGNDIGGSIRFPAFCNGVVGLRPTPGRVPSCNPSSALPRAMASQLMAVQGPLANTVRDVAASFKVMCEGDHRDPLWVPVPLEAEPLSTARRVALVVSIDGPPLHQAAAEAVRLAGRHLAAAGYIVEEVSPPGLHRAYELWNTIGMTDVRALVEPLLDKVGDPDLATALGDWWQFFPGTVDLRTYQAALAERDALVREWNAFMQTWPLVVTPVCTQPWMPAFGDARPGGMRAFIEAGRFLLMLPVLGFPGLAVPVGAHDGQPQGVQIISRRWREDLCIEAGAVIEAREGRRTPIDPRG